MNTELNGGGICPNFKICDREVCKKEGVCMNVDYWLEIHKKNANTKTSFEQPERQQRDKPFSGFTCCYCGRYYLERDQFTKEHLVPRSWGGNQARANLRDCCVECNHSRSDKSFATWRSQLKGLSKNATAERLMVLEKIIENTLFYENYIQEHKTKLYRKEHLLLEDI